MSMCLNSLTNVGDVSPVFLQDLSAEIVNIRSFFSYWMKHKNEENQYI